MEIQPVDFSAAALGIGGTSSPRAPILHASDIYSDYYQDLEPARYKKDRGGPAPILLETGLIFESMLEEGLKRRFAASAGSAEQIERPGEFIYEGTFDGHEVRIAYNPDLLIFNGFTRLGEIKATWMSSRIPHAWLVEPEVYASNICSAFQDAKYAKYFTQIKLYCKFLGLTRARLYTCFIAGDYTRPYQTQIVAVNVDFHPDEIETEYATLMRHAISKGML